MRPLTESLGYAWGQTVARYFAWSVRRERLRIEGLENFPATPAISISWHTANLLGLVTHRHVRPGRPSQSFVPHGFVGAVASGWVERAGMRAAPLPDDGQGNARAAVRQLAQALGRGDDVVVAVDGPHGPARRVRPGAVWLARLSGVPLLPVGLAARPAVRLRRWDRLIVPLPNAAIAVAIGPPMWIDRGAKIDAGLLESVGLALEAVTQRAWQLLPGASH